MTCEARRTAGAGSACRLTSAQLEFILYDLRGWMVSFCTVSISSASSSWSNTWQLRTKAHHKTG